MKQQEERKDLEVQEQDKDIVERVKDVLNKE